MDITKYQTAIDDLVKQRKDLEDDLTRLTNRIKALESSKSDQKIWDNYKFYKITRFETMIVFADCKEEARKVMAGIVEDKYREGAYFINGDGPSAFGINVEIVDDPSTITSDIVISRRAGNDFGSFYEQGVTQELINDYMECSGEIYNQNKST